MESGLTRFSFSLFKLLHKEKKKKIEHPQIPLYDVSLKKRLHNRANSGHQNPQKPSPPPLPTNGDAVFSPICLMLLNGLVDVFLILSLDNVYINMCIMRRGVEYH